MGITIHYSGRAKDWDALTQLLSVAQQFAAQRDWTYAIYDDPFGVMEDRDHDDPGYIEHDGPFRGIVINPHAKCESVRLDFNISNELSGFTKTQFAPFRVHTEIVALLRAIEPFIADLVVLDESGFWETGDEADARARFRFLGNAIESLGNELRARGLEVEEGSMPTDPAHPDRDLPAEEQPYG